MPASDTYTFRILVDGKALDEYEVEEKGSVYSCWIASEMGKNFSIQWTGADTGVDLQSTISMDGRQLRSQVHLGGSKAIDSTTKGCFIDACTQKMFAFSQVSLTDDEAIAPLDQNLSDLGTIDLSVYRVEWKPVATQAAAFANTPRLEDSVIHERSKKMSMHRTSFQGTQTFKKPTVSYFPKSKEKSPHARFIFKYRPRDFLRAQGIIPDDNIDDGIPGDETPSKPSTPAPTNKKRKRDRAADVENEEQEERKSRENINTRKQMQELQAKLDLLENGGGRVKREIKSEPFAFRAIDANGVIDLTDD